MEVTGFGRKKIPALRLGSRDAWGGVLKLNAGRRAVKTRLGGRVIYEKILLVSLVLQV